MSVMFAIGNNQLGALIPAGASIKCHRCDKSHAVQFGTENLESSTIAFYTCGKKTYLCGVCGRLIPGEELADD